jgi:Domain of unknown function (DUF397)
MNSVEWRKASRSGNNGACVEVGRLDAGTVGVRDSKDRSGPVLRFSPADWLSFVDAVREQGFHH